jgi:hypothetical protein
MDMILGIPLDESYSGIHALVDLSVYVKIYQQLLGEDSKVHYLFMYIFYSFISNYKRISTDYLRRGFMF